LPTNHCQPTPTNANQRGHVTSCRYITQTCYVTHARYITKPFHKTLLVRVRVIYDFHGLNVPYDFNGDPKTKKMVGFRNKSTIKIAAAVQQVCPSDTNANFAA
jgi:hypothetical protein